MTSNNSDVRHIITMSPLVAKHRQLSVKLKAVKADMPTVQ